jgi:hypothetical protein
MPLNSTLGSQINALVNQAQPAGVVAATVETVQGDKATVRIQRSADLTATSVQGRRITNVPVIGGTNRLKQGDTVYTMQISPQEYVVLSPKSGYAPGGETVMATDHAHAGYLTLADLTQILGGYALVSHTHSFPSSTGLKPPAPAIITPVDATGYAGTAGCAGALYDHRHNLPLDITTLQFSGASLGVAPGVFAPQSHVGSEGVSQHGVATSASAGFLPALDGNATHVLSGIGTWIAQTGGSGGGGAPLDPSLPQALGAAAAGTSASGAHGDHIHPTTGLVLSSRAVNTTAPLTGGGTLAGDLTLAISAATDASAGALSAADKTKLDGIATGATNTPLDSTAPQNIGTTAAGSSASGAHGNHVHDFPTDIVFDPTAVSFQISSSGSSGLDLPGLMLNGDVTLNPPGINIVYNNNTSPTSVGPNISVYRSRGTSASPATVQSGDELGDMTWGGFNSLPSGLGRGGKIRGYAVENWSSASMGTKLDVYTTPKQSVTNRKIVEFSDDGNLYRTTDGDLKPFLYAPAGASPGAVAPANTEWDTLRATGAYYFGNKRTIGAGVAVDIPADASVVVSSYFSIAGTLTIEAGASLEIR